MGRREGAEAPGMLPGSSEVRNVKPSIFSVAGQEVWMKAQEWHLALTLTCPGTSPLALVK